MFSFHLPLSLALLLFAIPLSSDNHPSNAIGEIITTSSMNVARSGHTATLLRDGSVLIAGGMRRNGDFTNTAETYDPKSNKFTPAGNMLVGRVGAAAAQLPSGRVLIVGGWFVTDDAEIYDPASRTFKSAGHMTERRARPSATLLQDGTVLVAGGEVDSDTMATTTSAEVFDEGTGKFTRVGAMHVGRVTHTATLLKGGRVLITGGGTGREQVTDTAEIYDPKTRSFSLAGNMAKPRHKQTAILLDNGSVLVAGGSDQRDWVGAYDSAEIFDPASNRFTLLSSKMSSGRFKLPGEAALLPNREVFIFGGARGGAIFDQRTKDFAQVPGPADTERFYPTATALRDGRVLLAGGYPKHSDAATTSAWLYVSDKP
jgi:hypothetical protein